MSFQIVVYLLKRSVRLRRLQERIVQHMLLLEADFPSLECRKKHEDLKRRYLDLCEDDFGVKTAMEHLDLTRDDLWEIHLELCYSGLARWIDGHFAALSTVAYHEPLFFYVESKKRGQHPVEIANQLADYWAGNMGYGGLLSMLDTSASGKVSERFISQDAYDELIQNEKTGNISIGVERSFARNLLTEVPIANIESVVGEPVWAVAILMRIAYRAPLVLYAMAIILWANLLSPWMLFGLPLTIPFWMFYTSRSVRGKSTLGFPSLCLTLSLINWLFWNIGNTILVPLVVFCLGMWLQRSAYVFPARVVRRWVTRGRKAFHWMYPGLDIRRVNCNDELE